MKTQTNSAAVNLELTARVTESRPAGSPNPKKDKTGLFAVLLLAAIPAAVFGLQALKIINITTY